MFVVAELGTNTNGSLALALRMVEEAHAAGVDGIKVQCYHTADFLPEGHPDWEMFEQARLSFEECQAVCAYTHSLGLKFGGTPTNFDGIEFLTEIGADWLKNGSDYLLRHDMIEAMVQTGLPTWVAVGMATDDEMRASPAGAKRLACTSSYPCPDGEANIDRVRNWRIDGYSDHTVGTTAGVMAVALGAEMFEFHYTTDHHLPGPDHHFSRDYAETKALVDEIRRAEKMLGSGEFEPTPSELENLRWRVTEAEPLRG